MFQQIFLYKNLILKTDNNWTDKPKILQSLKQLGQNKFILWKLSFFLPHFT